MSHITLKEQKEAIFLLVDYAAPEEQIREAKKIVDGYQADRIALNIFQEFYSYLPYAENDSPENDYIKRLQLLESKKWTFLILATTKLSSYIYLATLDRAVFLGSHQEGIWDKEVLEYFNMDREEAIKKFKDTEGFQDYISLDRNNTHCRVCSVAVGEEHRLGCAAEICPWCDGQLSICSCKFTQLGVEKIKTEKQLKAFHEILGKKGRITFDISQQPGGWRNNKD